MSAAGEVIQECAKRGVLFKIKEDGQVSIWGSKPDVEELFPRVEKHIKDVARLLAKFEFAEPPVLLRWLH